MNKVTLQATVSSLCTKRVLRWSGFVFLGLLVLLFFRSQSWKLVHVFPSGTEEAEYLNRFSISPMADPSPLFDRSPDGNSLVIHCRDQSVEIRSLVSGKLLRRISSSETLFNPHTHPEYTPNRITAFLDETTIYFENVDGRWISHVEGVPETLQAVFSGEPWPWRFRTMSPNRRYLVGAGMRSMEILDFYRNTLVASVPLPPKNGSYQISWTADSELFLLKDLLGVDIFRSATGERIHERRELDLRTPWPHHADDKSGFHSGAQTDDGYLPKDRTRIYGVVAAAISPQGRHWVTVYHQEEDLTDFIHFRNAETHALIRVYDVASGEVVWEKP